MVRGLGRKGHYCTTEAHKIRSYYSEAEIEEHGDLEAPACRDIGPAVDLVSWLTWVSRSVHQSNFIWWYYY